MKSLTFLGPTSLLCFVSTKIVQQNKPTCNNLKQKQFLKKKRMQWIKSLKKKKWKIISSATFFHVIEFQPIRICNFNSVEHLTLFLKWTTTMVKASLRILKSLLCQSLSISLQKILWETSVFHLFCLCFLIKFYISLDPLYTRTQTNSRLFHHLRLNAVCCGSREQINTKAEAAHSSLEEKESARENKTKSCFVRASASSN